MSSSITAAVGDILVATGLAVLGILPLAACIAGFLFARLTWPSRALLFLAAMLLLLPGSELTSGRVNDIVVNVLGVVVFAGVALFNWSARSRERPAAA